MYYHNNDFKLIISLLIISYIIGSISAAILLCKLFKFSDPRLQGSKNPGTTNVLRVAGKKLALMVLLIDVFKGFSLVFLARVLFACSNSIIAMVALFGFLGQLFPIFFGFRGGKGIAITLGILLSLYWPLALCCLFIWIIVFIKFRISSLAGIIANSIAIFASLLNILLNNIIIPLEFSMVILIIGILILFKHKTNIIDLLKKRERPI